MQSASRLVVPQQQSGAMLAERQDEAADTLLQKGTPSLTSMARVEDEERTAAGAARRVARHTETAIRRLARAVEEDPEEKDEAEAEAETAGERSSESEARTVH